MSIFSSNKSAPEVPQGVEAKHSLLASGVIFEGTIQSAGDIRIEGKIKGKLICKSKVVVGPTGIIEGDIESRNAAIAGEIRGKVHVFEVLQVQETAKIYGDVVTEKINIQTGGVISGQIKMGQDAHNDLKKITNPANARPELAPNV
jgi:cytoskeletal protein CcmA (bactofilin family)